MEATRRMLLRVVRPSGDPEHYELEPGTRKLGVVIVPPGQLVYSQAAIQHASKPLREAGIDALMVLHRGDSFEVLEVVPTEALGEPDALGTEEEVANVAYKAWMGATMHRADPPALERHSHEAFIAGWNARAALDAEHVAGIDEEAAPPKEICVEAIKRAVTRRFDVRMRDLLGRDRHEQVSLARHVAMYLTRRLLGLSFPEIGAAFGGRDHTTVMAAVRKVSDLVSADQAVRGHVAAVEAALDELYGKPAEVLPI